MFSNEKGPLKKEKLKAKQQSHGSQTIGTKLLHQHLKIYQPMH